MPRDQLFEQPPWGVIDWGGGTPVARLSRAGEQIEQHGQQKPREQPECGCGGQGEPPDGAKRGQRPRLHGKQHAQVKQAEQPDRIGEVIVAPEEQHKADDQSCGAPAVRKPLDVPYRERQKRHGVEPHQADAVDDVVGHQGIAEAEDQRGQSGQMPPPLQIELHGQPAQPGFQAGEQRQGERELLCGKQQQQPVERGGEIIGEQPRRACAELLLQREKQRGFARKQRPQPRIKRRILVAHIHDQDGLVPGGGIARELVNDPENQRGQTKCRRSRGDPESVSPQC